jgi:sugar lactone lactonase YvrE
MWVAGLNAPKGMRAANGTLWVADLGEVVAINMADGQIASKTAIPGAQFLNDVAVGDDGTVYVSDTFGSKIFTIKDGRVATFVEGPDFEYPNGLLVEGGKLVVGGWGKPNPDFTTEVPGRVYSIDIATKTKTNITPDPAGNFDGIESDGRGGYIATDYMKGAVLRIMPNGEVRQVSTFMPGTADLAFAPAQNLAIVPHMNENKVAAYDISAALQ